MSGYGAVAWLLLVVLAGAGALYGIGRLVRLPGPAREVPPYLSGLPPREHAVSRFHVRWYAVTLLFLAFDMEMIFMYPWAVVFGELGVVAFLDMLVFIGLLSAAIAYAWGMGGLAWE